MGLAEGVVPSLSGPEIKTDSNETDHDERISALTSAECGGTYQPTGRPPGRFGVITVSREITKRRVWDSNPRGRVNALAVFKTAAIGH
jgi:hypothetical protein